MTEFSTYVGLDTHKDMIAVAVAKAGRELRQSCVLLSLVVAPVPRST